MSIKSMVKLLNKLNFNNKNESILDIGCGAPYFALASSGLTKKKIYCTELDDKYLKLKTMLKTKNQKQ